MREATDRPTLLIFTRGAERETRRRRLLPRRLAALELAFHRRCLDSAVAAGRAAGCSIAVSSPSPVAGRGIRRLPQEGRGFGERLRVALSHALRDGPAPIPVVGTDIPGLPSRHLRAAITRLRDDPGATRPFASTAGLPTKAFSTSSSR